MHPPMALVDCGNAQHAWRYDLTAAPWAASGPCKARFFLDPINGSIRAPRGCAQLLFPRVGEAPVCPYWRRAHRVTLCAAQRSEAHNSGAHNSGRTSAGRGGEAQRRAVGRGRGAAAAGWRAQGAGQRAKIKTRPERRYLRPSERHPPEEAPEIHAGCGGGGKLVLQL